MKIKNNEKLVRQWEDSSVKLFLTDFFPLSLLRLYKYQMLITKSIAALHTVRVQKLSWGGGGAGQDAGWLAVGRSLPSGDLQMFPAKAIAIQCLPRIAICFARIYDLPWKSGAGSWEQCHVGLCPPAGLPLAIRSAERVRFWWAGLAFSMDATPSFANNAAVPSSIYVMVSICNSARPQISFPVLSPRLTQPNHAVTWRSDWQSP